MEITPDTPIAPLAALLTKLVQRHGERLPDVLPPLQVTFERFRAELEQHMTKEDLGVPHVPRSLLCARRIGA